MMHGDPEGIGINEPTAAWIIAALDLRISPSGDDGAEAAENVLDILRAFIVERANSIAIERRLAVVHPKIKITPLPESCFHAPLQGRGARPVSPAMRKAQRVFEQKKGYPGEEG